ncbi:MAG: dihydrodipicolinate synthase family protein [Actinomycetota bacterium]
MKDKLSGVFVPTITPFEGDEVQYAKLEENLIKLNKSPISGHLALGSNGEYKSLTRDEQLKVLEVFVKNKGDKIIMAGTGCESTAETIQFSKEAERIGADFVSALTPSYFKKIINDEVLINYYTEVADNINIPLLIYNAPGFTGGVTISAKAVRKLARHPNIVGMKDSSKAGIMSYITATMDIDDFYVLAGSINFFFTGLVCGAVGGVLSLSNAIPNLCCKLYNLYLNGKIEEAKHLHLKLFQVNGKVSGANAVSGVKAAASICGYFGGEPRKPLIPLSPEEKKELKEYFKQEGLI